MSIFSNKKNLDKAKFKNTLERNDNLLYNQQNKVEFYVTKKTIEQMIADRQARVWEALKKQVWTHPVLMRAFKSLEEFDGNVCFYVDKNDLIDPALEASIKQGAFNNFSGRSVLFFCSDPKVYYSAQELIDLISIHDTIQECYGELKFEEVVNYAELVYSNKHERGERKILGGGKVVFKNRTVFTKKLNGSLSFLIQIK